MSTTVLCLPPAGAGPSFFRDWTGQAVGLDIEPVGIPGREQRFSEPEQHHLADLLAVLVPEVLPVARAADRVVVFGHSFGAILAYELCRALSEADAALPLMLVPSGSARPGVPRSGRITGLPDEAFIAAVEVIAGYRHPALGEPELREVLLPPLRADVAMHENYRPAAGSPLDLPVLAIRGSRDTLVGAEQAGQWRETTTGPFRLAEVEGDHMYLVDAWPELLTLVAQAARRLEHCG